MQKPMQTTAASPQFVEGRRASRVIVLLPAYNEAANLPGLLDRICDHLWEDRFNFIILVVDDGSADATPNILADYSSRIPLTTLRHEVNQGLGSSIRDGLFQASAMAEKRDIIVTMDADETHTPGLILRMVHMIREGHDVVIASRYQRGSRVYGLSAHRRFVSRAASLLMRVLFPIPGVSDYTCGYRAYRAEVLQQAYERYGRDLVDQSGFQCTVDILLKLRTMPIIFGEVPFILRYDLKQGQSKMRLMRTALETLRLLILRKFRQ
ncbi:MAG TPA: glycosyltransferase [Bryobacteraceae bacterium]|nr:glycosyltransferase [Bryobacteraceae bacterium]